MFSKIDTLENSLNIGFNDLLRKVEGKLVFMKTSCHELFKKAMLFWLL